jgi:hypothetical protein
MKLTNQRTRVATFMCDGKHLFHKHLHRKYLHAVAERPRLSLSDLNSRRQKGKVRRVRYVI